MKVIYKDSFLIIIFLLLILLKEFFFSYKVNSNLDLTALKIENQELKRELSNYLIDIDTTKYLNYEYYVTPILFSNFNNLYNTGLIMLGSESGIEEGMLVLNADGLVGIVSKTFKSSSEVSMLTSKNEISVKINNSYGILTNYNALENNFTISKIDNYENIKVGDIVYTSGLGIYEKNIKVGVVIAIHQDENKIEQEVIMTSDVSFNNLSYVLVLKG